MKRSEASWIEHRFMYQTFYIELDCFDQFLCSLVKQIQFSYCIVSFNTVSQD